MWWGGGVKLSTGTSIMNCTGLFLSSLGGGGGTKPNYNDARISLKAAIKLGGLVAEKGWTPKTDRLVLRDQTLEKLRGEEHLLREILPSQACEACHLLSEVLKDHQWLTFANSGPYDRLQSEWLWGRMLDYFMRSGRVWVRMNLQEKIIGCCIWQSPTESGGGRVSSMLRSGIGLLPAVWGAQATWCLIQTWKSTENLLCETFTEPFWFLCIIGVSETEQRKGYGSQLLQPICRQADQAGILCVAALPDLSSLVFFEKWGFQIRFHVPSSKWGSAEFWIIQRRPHPFVPNE
eukprot:TRINITY_DN8123_c0_g2_i2.p1 TRINITY_DN8123_c0_g2~~TRINITY_DN8123_c0_g2_i2.p1  ORF type:complete len:291 (+),score=49.48 TRINITY_DN8123_c0_g2_i2:172-1044(+)